jgi:thioredoxin-like negative regulator of GroEL
MNLLFVIGLLIIFIIIAVIVYRQYMKKISNNPNNEFIKSDKSAELMLFYVDWCPYSKSTLKQWYKYKETYNGKYKLSFVEIDCDKETNLADSYNIEAYPTIILLLDGKKYIYDAQMDPNTLTQFINTIMN